MIKSVGAEALSRRAPAGPPIGAPFAGLGRYGGIGRFGNDAGLAQEQYLHNAGYVYSLIRTIANRIIGQPVVHARKLPHGTRPDKGNRVFKQHVPECFKGDAQQLHTFTDSPVLRAFRNPNPIMVRYTVMFNTVASLELTGKAFWWLRWSAGNKPEIWPHLAALAWQALWVAITIAVGARAFRRGVLKSGSGPRRRRSTRKNAAA